MSASALRAEDHFPKESPSFQPPMPSSLEEYTQSKLAAVLAASEAYFAKTEAFVSFWESDADALGEVVSRFSLTGGDPKLGVLIDQAGEHLERTHAEVLPQIDSFRQLRRQAAAIKIPRAKEVMISSIDRNLALMRRYVKAIEAIYDRLIWLRDQSIQQSIAGLTMAAWGGLWDDDE